jgi:entericidin B
MNMRKANLLIAAMLATGFLAGCNTMEGLGKDIKRGGEVLEKAADKAKS